MSSIFFCALVLCFLLSACDDTAPKQTFKTKTKTKKIKSESSDVEAIKKIVYVYNPAGTRDPFKNPFSIEVEILVDNSVPLTPLQKIDLDQLRLIGLIIGKGEPRAMVLSPDGKSFILKKGVKIGRNNGVVYDITTEAVLIEERYLDFVGDTKKRIQKIKLPKRKE
jgi:type IV pilus assembly protein PilP